MLRRSPIGAGGPDRGRTGRAHPAVAGDGVEHGSAHLLVEGLVLGGRHLGVPVATRCRHRPDRHTQRTLGGGRRHGRPPRGRDSRPTSRSSKMCAGETLNKMLERYLQLTR